MARDFALLVVTPDLLAQRRLVAVLGRLAAAGCEVVAAVPRQLAPVEVALLYDVPGDDGRGHGGGGGQGHVDAGGSCRGGGNRHGHVGGHGHVGRRPHAAWLTPALFCDSALALILRGARAAGTSLQARLRELKGESRWGHVDAATLRGSSPLTDRNFSAVHCPDNTERYLVESGLFFGESGRERAEAPARAALPAATVVALLPHLPLAAETTPLALVPRLVGQALALACCDPRTAPAAATAAARLLPAVAAAAHATDVGVAGATGAAAAHATDVGVARATEAAAAHATDVGVARATGAAAASVAAARPAAPLWQTLEPIAPALAGLAAAEAAAAVPLERPADRVAQHARIELWLGWAAFCAGARAGPRTSLAVVDAAARCGLAPAHWETHRLHLLATYHHVGAA